MRGEGAAFGRRTVGRERSHLGLNKESAAAARAPRRGRGGGGCPGGALRPPASAPSGSGGVVANPSLGDSRTVTQKLSQWAATEAARRVVGSPRLLPPARFLEQ